MRDFEGNQELWVKTSMALTDFTSRQTNFPELMALLKGYIPAERWQTTVRKILKTDFVMNQMLNARGRAHPGYDVDTIWASIYKRSGKIFRQ